MVKFSIVDIEKCRKFVDQTCTLLSQQNKNATTEHDVAMAKIEKEISAVRKDISVAEGDIAAVKNAISVNNSTMERTKSELAAGKQRLTALEQEKANLIDSEPVYEKRQIVDSSGNIVTKRVQVGWKTPEAKMNACLREIAATKQEISRLEAKIGMIKNAISQLLEMKTEINNCITQKRYDYSDLISKKDSLMRAYESFFSENRRTHSIFLNMRDIIGDVSSAAQNAVNVLLDGICTDSSFYPDVEIVCLPKDGAELLSLATSIETQVTNLANLANRVSNETDRFRHQIKDAVSYDVKYEMSNILKDLEDIRICLTNESYCYKTAAKHFRTYYSYKQ